MQFMKQYNTFDLFLFLIIFIRLTTALDGSTLYCCPECHMAYPEKELLEQHLLGHTLERRFVCNICGAGLKRKDHLTRHKQSHNPERPFVCSVCLKVNFFFLTCWPTFDHSFESLINLLAVLI